MRKLVGIVFFQESCFESLRNQDIEICSIIVIMNQRLPQILLYLSRTASYTCGLSSATLWLLGLMRLMIILGLSTHFQYSRSFTRFHNTRAEWSLRNQKNTTYCKITSRSGNIPVSSSYFSKPLLGF